ncbi:uncharacterized protein LOC135812117 [Sycon ciliatum]|uniref:uncharacterized protein LOC135812117 n=1 Tax=Sycon ciliatum TaxID=27933 RepID=UPI0031F65353
MQYVAVCILAFASLGIALVVATPRARPLTNVEELSESTGRQLIQRVQGERFHQHVRAPVTRRLQWLDMLLGKYMLSKRGRPKEVKTLQLYVESYGRTPAAKGVAVGCGLTPERACATVSDALRASIELKSPPTLVINLIGNPKDGCLISAGQTRLEVVIERAVSLQVRAANIKGCKYARLMYIPGFLRLYGDYTLQRQSVSLESLLFERAEASPPGRKLSYSVLTFASNPHSNASNSLAISLRDCAFKLTDDVGAVQVVMKNNETLHVTLSQCNFTGVGLRSTGGSMVSSHSVYISSFRRTRIDISNSRFTNLYSATRSWSFYRQAIVRLSTGKQPPIPGAVHIVNTVFEKCIANHLIDNQGFDLRVQSSSFLNNLLISDAIQTDYEKSLNVNNCVFLANQLKGRMSAEICFGSLEKELPDKKLPTRVMRIEGNRFERVFPDGMEMTHFQRFTIVGYGRHRPGSRRPFDVVQLSKNEFIHSTVYARASAPVIRTNNVNFKMVDNIYRIGRNGTAETMTVKGKWDNTFGNPPPIFDKSPF